MNKTIQNTLQLTDDYTDYAKKVMCDCIAHEIYNAVARGDTRVTIDLGICDFTLDFSTGTAFLIESNLNPMIIPAINSVLVDGKDPLTEDLERKLDVAVSNLYKELL